MSDKKVAKRVEHQERRRILKAFARAAKDRPCMDCGLRYPYYVMDFDHRDPAVKFKDVSNLIVSSYSMKTVATEIAKCDVVCANCHRMRTFAKNQF